MDKAPSKGPFLFIPIKPVCCVGKYLFERMRYIANMRKGVNIDLSKIFTLM